MASMTATELLHRYGKGERDFRGADLRSQTFLNKDLSGINLEGADIRGTRFLHVTLRGAILAHAHGGLNSAAILIGIATCLILPAIVQKNLAPVLLPMIVLSKQVITVIGLFLSIIIVSSYLIVVSVISLGSFSAASVVTNKAFLLCAFMIIVFGAILPNLLDLKSISMYNYKIRTMTAMLFGIVVIFIPFLLCVLYSIGFILWLALMFSAAQIIGGLRLSISSVILALIGGIFCIASQMHDSLISNFCVILCSWAHIFISVYICKNIMFYDDRYIRIKSLLLAMLSQWATCFCDSDLMDADFGYSQFDVVDFERANVFRTNWSGARGMVWGKFATSVLSSPIVQCLVTSGIGSGALLGGMDLAGLQLQSADLTHANLTDCSLRDANLERADLRAARLNGANLCGANLSGANIEATDLQAATIDVHTYCRSAWTPSLLIQLRNRGAHVIGLEAFPEEVQVQLLGTLEGLTLTFSKRLSIFDRYLVDGIIIGLLGPNPDCRVAEYRERGDAAIVRLTAVHRENLELVAEALYRRIWEFESEQRRQHQQNLIRLADLFDARAIREGLTNLRAYLDEIELRLPEPAMSATSEVDVHAALARRHFTWRLAGTDRIEVARMFRVLVLHDLNERDNGLLLELESHMSGLVAQGLIHLWHLGHLDPGEDRALSLMKRVREADVMLVLVSSDMLRALTPDATISDKDMGTVPRFLLAEALTYAFERQRKRELRLIPLLLRPVDYSSTPFSQLQPLPDSGKPVTSQGEDRDGIWQEVVSSLRRKLLTMT